MELAITRGPNHETSCIGDFFIDDKFECYSLEDLVREVEGQPVSSWKIAGETAIPRGRYRVIIDFSTRFQKDMIHILDVPGFTGVRIHGGNTAENTEGCPLVGLQRDDDSIRNCAYAVKNLFDRVKEAIDSGDEVWITIT